MTDSHPASQPTRVRYLVVFVSMLMAVLLYLDRFCVGIAEPYIKQELGLSTFQVGLFFSAFFLTYALGQVPSGWLSDRFGPRTMLSLYILAWSLFTAMMGLAYGFAMLLLMRAAYGLGQAGAYPTSANVVSKWIPFSGRGAASSIVAFGGRFGGAIAPILTAFLIVLFVPLNQSSLLTLPDLRDAAELCVRLSPTQQVPLMPHLKQVRHVLPDDLIPRIDRVAEQSRPLIKRREDLQEEARSLQKTWRMVAAYEKSKQAQAIQLDVSETDRQALLDGFNSVIQSRSLYEPGTFDKLKRMDRAAIDYLKRVRGGEQLTTQEFERFNRLLLEACFPDELGKVYVGGWRPVMIAYGMAGLLVAGLFWAVVRNRPDQHPWCNPAEQELIAEGRPGGAPSPHGKPGNVPWAQLLTSRSMWFNCFGQFGTNIGWLFIVTWFPRYLLEVHTVPIIERGWMAATPMFAGWLGMLSGGRLTDWLVGRVGLRWGRRIPWSFSRLIGVAAFLSCPFLDSPWAVTTALALVAISTDLGTASAWAFCQDVGGRYVGSILGWGNMWGNLGATVSPLLLAWVFDNYGWPVMFDVCAGAFLLAGLFALGIDATIPIAPPDEDHEG